MTAAILTPMANPTVEAELRMMLPRDLPWVTGRLVSDEADSARRLIAYAESLPAALRQFDTLPLSVVAFACTASSYLVGQDRLDALAGGLPVPVIWATEAIEQRLARLGAGRIALLSPYPQPLHAAALAFWRAKGIVVVNEARIDIGSTDTRAIYALASDAPRAAIAQAQRSGADAVLLSGTGMPTASLLDPDGAPPVISSNLCLAEAIIAAMGAST